MKDFTQICTACPDYPWCNTDRERIYDDDFPILHVRFYDFFWGRWDNRTFLIYDFLKNEASVITVLAMNQKKWWKSVTVTMIVWWQEVNLLSFYHFRFQSYFLRERADNDDRALGTSVLSSFFYRDSLLRLATYNTIRELFVYSNEVLKLYFSLKIVFIRISQQFYLLSFRKK